MIIIVINNNLFLFWRIWKCHMIKCALHDGGKSEVLKNEKKKKMREYLHSNVTLLLVGHRWKLRVLQVLCPLHAV